MFLLLLFACTGEDIAGYGNFELTASGGQALEEGFPYTESDQTFEFIDGWELAFTSYKLSFSQIELRDPETDELIAEWSESITLDLAQGPSSITTIEDIPALRYNFGFLMKEPVDDKGWNYLIEGEATRDSETILFSLGLTIPTSYYRCINGKDQTEGIAIESSKTVGAYIYSHPHHIFWDTLAYGDEDLRFDPWAAVSGDDGVVTAEELETQDLTDLLDSTGSALLDENGNRLMYDDGGLLHPEDYNLLEFVRYAVRASAHFNGVGYCRMEPLD